MGNVTVTVIKRNISGAQRQVLADVTFSSSYATGGDTIVAADIAKLLPEASAGLADLLMFNDRADATGNFTVLDTTNKKFLAFTVAGTEKGNATNQSTLVLRCQFVYGQATG